MIAITLAWFAGPASADEAPVNKERLLLLYGNHRVEYVPAERPGQGGDSGRLMLIGGEHLARPAPARPQVPRIDLDKKTGLVPLPKVDEPPPEEAEGPGNSGALLSAGKAWEASQDSIPFPSRNLLREPQFEQPSAGGVIGPALPSQAREPAAIEIDPSPQPAARPGERPEASLALRENTAETGPDGQTGFSPNWLFTGLAQAAGTVVGLLFGGLVGSFVLVAVRNRSEVKEFKFEPIIRLEMPSPDPWGNSPARSGRSQDTGSDSAKQQATAVADFRDEVISFDLSAVASRQRDEEAARKRERHEELLQRIYEDNLAFRKAAAARAA
jgi:hypothetical protein